MTEQDLVRAQETMWYAADVGYIWEYWQAYDRDDQDDILEYLGTTDPELHQDITEALAAATARGW